MSQNYCGIKKKFKKSIVESKSNMWQVSMPHCRLEEGVHAVHDNNMLEVHSN